MMRVFIADDEEIIRDGIRNCIENYKTIYGQKY